jgi:hypothetical protein
MLIKYALSVKEGAMLLHGAKLATFCTGSPMADENHTIDLVETPVGICNT